MVRINKILRDKIMGVEKRCGSGEAGAAYVEFVIGMLFAVLFFSVLIPMIGGMQEDGDSAVTGSYAVQIVGENPENRRLLAETITGKYFMPNADVLAQLNANVAAAISLGAGSPTFAAVTVFGGLVYVYAAAGAPLTPGDNAFLTGQSASSHLMFFKDSNSPEDLFALPALYATNSAAGGGPVPPPTPGPGCCHTGIGPSYTGYTCNPEHPYLVYDGADYKCASLDMAAFICHINPDIFQPVLCAEVDPFTNPCNELECVLDCNCMY